VAKAAEGVSSAGSMMSPTRPTSDEPLDALNPKSGEISETEQIEQIEQMIRRNFVPRGLIAEEDAHEVAVEFVRLFQQEREAEHERLVELILKALSEPRDKPPRG
jgi:hypothetical protein